MNPFGMMKDMKNMEKMMKPALEKFMKESGFVKKEDLEPLKRRIAELEAEVKRLKQSVIDNLKPEDISRIIEMAWEDRTTFDAIEATFGLNQNQVEDLMRKNLKKSSYTLWRKRARGRKTKHLGLRDFEVGRHHSYDQNKYKK